VIRLRCGACGSTVEGAYDLPILAQLDDLDQQLVLDLVKASGSLKDVTQKYGISYPTMRNRVDVLIERISALDRKTS
jgi:hypothetical protein